MKSNGMTNKNPVTYPHSDFSPYRKKVYDAPKIRAKPNFYFLKKASMSDFFLKKWHTKTGQKGYVPYISYPSNFWI